MTALSQEAFAQAAGVSVNTLRAVERGTANPTSRTLAKLEAALAANGVIFVVDTDGMHEGVRRRLAPEASTAKTVQPKSVSGR